MENLPQRKFNREKFERGKKLLSDVDLVYIDPDFIDLFVDHLISTGTDLYSFQISRPEYRAKIYNRWFNSLPGNKRQLSLNL